MTFLSIGGGPTTISTKTKILLNAMTDATGWVLSSGGGGDWSGPGNVLAQAHRGPMGAAEDWLRFNTSTTTVDGTSSGHRADITVASVDASLMSDIGWYCGFDTIWHSTANTGRLQSISVWLGSDGDKSFSNSVSADYTMTADEWPASPLIKFLSFDRTDFAVQAGTFDWSALQDIRIQFLGSAGTFGTAGNETVSMYCQGLYMNQRVTPTVVIHHDDGASGVYSLAFPEMQSRGLKSTQFVIPALADVGTGITLPQLTEMYSAGHDICLHCTYSGDVLGGAGDTTTLAETAADLTLGLAWQDTNGFMGAKHVTAWPQGDVTCTDGIAYNTFVAQGVTVARGATDGVSADEWSATDTNDDGNNLDTMSLTILQLNATNLPSTLLADQLVRVEKYGGILHLSFHNILASGATGNNLNLDEYEIALDMLVNHQDKGLIQVKTMSEVYDTDGSLLI